MTEQQVFSGTGRAQSMSAGSATSDGARREAEVLERLWGVQTCDVCGTTILLGEEVFHPRGSAAMCSACATAPLEGDVGTALVRLSDRCVATGEAERAA